MLNRGAGWRRVRGKGVVEESLMFRCSLTKDEELGREGILKMVAGVAAVALVLGAGVWAGLALRRKRLSTYHDPYERRRWRRPRFRGAGEEEYEAVGI